MKKLLIILSLVAPALSIAMANKDSVIFLSPEKVDWDNIKIRGYECPKCKLILQRDNSFNIHVKQCCPIMGSKYLKELPHDLYIKCPCNTKIKGGYFTIEDLKYRLMRHSKECIPLVDDFLNKPEKFITVKSAEIKLPSFLIRNNQYIFTTNNTQVKPKASLIRLNKDEVNWKEIIERSYVANCSICSDTIKAGSPNNITQSLKHHLKHNHPDKNAVIELKNIKITSNHSNDLYGWCNTCDRLITSISFGNIYDLGRAIQDHPHYGNIFSMQSVKEDPWKYIMVTKEQNSETRNNDIPLNSTAITASTVSHSSLNNVDLPLVQQEPISNPHKKRKIDDLDEINIHTNQKKQSVNHKSVSNDETLSEHSEYSLHEDHERDTPSITIHNDNELNEIRPVTPLLTESPSGIIEGNSPENTILDLNTENAPLNQQGQVAMRNAIMDEPENQTPKNSYSEVTQQQEQTESILPHPADSDSDKTEEDTEVYDDNKDIDKGVEIRNSIRFLGLET